MRIIVKLQLERPELPKDFRPVFVSFIKNNLTKYGQLFFDEYYKDRNTIAKRFTFGVRMNRRQFKQNHIYLGGDIITFTLSTADLKEGAILYNSIVENKAADFPLPNRNKMKILTVKTEMLPKIEMNEIVIKMLSPLVIREHDRSSNVDTYIDCTCEHFAESVKRIVQGQIEIFGLQECLINGFSILPVKAKKTVITTFDYHIDASLGVFKLNGCSELLDFLYHAGLGSRRSQGFGMFEVLA